MIIEKIKLHNFRNFTELSLSFGKGANFLFGENGQGKTNLIEAIYCLGLSKSFRTSLDRDLIKIDQDAHSIHGQFISESSVKHRVSILQNHKKKLSSLTAKKIKDILNSLASRRWFCSARKTIA